MLMSKGAPTYLPINTTSNELIESRYKVVQEIIKVMGVINECRIIINSEYIYYKYVTIDKLSRLIYKFKKSSAVFYIL